MPEVQGTPPHRVLVASYGSDRYHFLRMRNMAPRTAHPEPYGSDRYHFLRMRNMAPRTAHPEPYGSDRYHFLRMRNMAPRTAHPEPPAIQLHPTHRQRTPQYAYVAELLRCGDLGHPERPARAILSRAEMRAIGGLES